MEGLHAASSILRTGQYLAPPYKIYSLGRPGARYLCTPASEMTETFAASPKLTGRRNGFLYGPLLSQSKDNCRTEFEHKTSTSETPRPPVSAPKAGLYLDTLPVALGVPWPTWYRSKKKYESETVILETWKFCGYDHTERFELRFEYYCHTNRGHFFFLCGLTVMCHTAAISRWDRILIRWMAICGCE